MPPQTRAIKTSKVSKENFSVVIKNKSKNNPKIVKRDRKPLSDKTNSASDDNLSVLDPQKPLTNNGKKSSKQEQVSKDRPRRARRLPTRYEENNLLKNLSNNNTISPQKTDSSSKHVAPPSEHLAVKITPHKVASKSKSSPLIGKRPKRICRLPSKLEAHSISPTKTSPIKPVHASTPILKKNRKDINQNDSKSIKIQKKLQYVKETSTNKSNKNISKQQNISDMFKRQNESNRATNNTISRDIQDEKRLRPKLNDLQNKSNEKVAAKKISSKDISIRLLEDKRKTLKRDSSKLDIYEFTYDPNEEPPPQKKKKKRTNTKPKKRVVKSKYEKNLEKALAALKSTISSKPQTQEEICKENNINKHSTNINKPTLPSDISININTNTNTKEVYTPIEVPNIESPKPNISNVSDKNYNSIRVEDIAMQFQDEDDHNINYSPVNSPVYEPEPIQENSLRRVSNKDPLNLQGDSFFEEPPAASSSMNSSRHPLASPWRVEFNNLPIKWQVNSYVKANMTPAIERSFICNDSAKKHVYTNIIEPEPLQDIPNLKQTSIISFIKEVVERKANKKKKHKVVQNNSLFEDITNTTVSEPITPKKSNVTNQESPEKSNNSNESISEKENSNSMENSENSIEIQKENSNSRKDKDVTYFGFDDSENQENVSPKKKNKKNKGLRPRNNAVLKEINGLRNQNAMPVAAMSRPIRIPHNVNKVFDEVKSAAEPPVFLDVTVNKSVEVTELNHDVDNSDEDSVHLFEDIEVVHHLKPTRKSYGKSKKVTFCKNSAVNNIDSDIEHSSDEDLDDLSFKLPSVKQKKSNSKKKSKKQLKTKKEEKEVEEWAAGFNSMCEDIDEFDLVVE